MASDGSRRGALAVEVTSRCNRACQYCYNECRGDSVFPDDTGAEELAALTNRVLDESGFSAVQITGGEPLLYPGLWDFIASISRSGRRISLVTDGALVDEQVIGKLRSLAVAPVQPTLLSSDRELHNELKGASCFDDTVGAIAAMKKAGIPVSVSFVCTKKNWSHFKGMVELCFALGVKVLAFSRFCTAGLGRRNQEHLAPDATMIRHCLEVAQEANTRLGMKVQIAISLPLCVVDGAKTPDLKFGRCALSTDSPGFTMDATGNLRACSISSTVLGNLQQESWQTIVSRAEMEYFANMCRVREMCGDCTLVHRCGGGCRESALGTCGDFGHPDPLVTQAK